MQLPDPGNHRSVAEFGRLSTVSHLLRDCSFPTVCHCEQHENSKPFLAGYRGKLIFLEPSSEPAASLRANILQAQWCCAVQVQLTAFRKYPTPKSSHWAERKEVTALVKLSNYDINQFGIMDKQTARDSQRQARKLFEIF